MNVAIEILEGAIKSKDKKEALAFCLKVKAMFGSSTLIKRNYSELQKTLRMSYNKTKRCIENALKYGYMREEGNLYIANKLSKGLCVKINVKEAKEPNAVLYIVRELEKAMMLVHISRVNYVAHSKNSASNPKSVEEFKKANRRLKKCGVNCNDNVTGRVSYIRLAEIAYIPRKRAIMLIRELVNSGVLSKEYFYEEQDVLFPKNGNSDDIYLDSVSTKNKRGYLIRMCLNGKISLFIQLSNIFTLNYKLIKYIK